MQKFLEHFAGISEALDALGLWDGADGLFYDRLVLPDGSSAAVRVRSMVAMIPPLAVAVVNEDAIDRTLVTDKMFADYLLRHGLGGSKEMAEAGILRGPPGRRRLLVGVTDVDKVRRLSSACSPTPGGETTCCFTSTSTATTAPTSVRRTRPGGRRWWLT
ncbi:hypothetical protein [Mycolicibacterium sp. CBMA 226]|uniref:hypothetical protein n=1 Tax=Mycolicibacterium sp. CBMA 226 TaxID=2606611 RepID=UPI0012DFDDF4|nr:hypothetical protein [Mycolicibacterium sp. CBMA 226]MUL80148.1 hypothetical protein [Mycolicibacterium sp. CBMA 226]